MRGHLGGPSLSCALAQPSSSALDASSWECDPVVYDDADHCPLLSAGTIKIGSKTVKLNAEFIAETLFLSSQLNVSELLAANLLRSGIALQSRHGNRPASDTAVIIFHAERADMLACLKLIFDPAVSGQAGSLELLDRFGAELKGSLVSLGQGKEGSIVERIMVDLEATKEVAHQLNNSLNQGAPSTSSAAHNQFAPPPPAQGTGGAKLSLEMTQQRITALKQERKALGHVLFLMSYSRNLRKKDVQAVVRWLSRQSGEGQEGDDVLGQMGIVLEVSVVPERGHEEQSPLENDDRLQGVMAPRLVHLESATDMLQVSTT